MATSVRLDPGTLLTAYSQGIFPMADEDGSIRWYSADPRGIFPLDAFHVPGTLRQVIRQGRFEMRINHDFEATMRACMQQRAGATWINDKLVRAYVHLHELGFAHSVEAWREEKLVGGLYGVSLGGAFFGESMFHSERDASKVALVHLVDMLRRGGFVLLDTQFLTSHLASFGAREIPRGEYLALLHRAIAREAVWPAP
jgi:leucyl/phenylalanyl-tRNA--protein transferase